VREEKEGERKGREGVGGAEAEKDRKRQRDRHIGFSA